MYCITGLKASMGPANPPLAASADAELDRLLAEEKMRSEVHRTNYSRIKAEFMRYGTSAKKNNFPDIKSRCGERLVEENHALENDIGRLEGACQAARNAAAAMRERSDADIQKANEELKVRR